MNKLFLMIFAVSFLGFVENSKAFTLIGNSEIKGWNTDTLTFLINYSGCSISEGDLNEAIDQAISLWNQAPLSGIKLARGGKSTTTPAQAKAAANSTNPASTPSPLIVCDPNLSNTLFPTGSDNAEYIPAATTPAVDGELRLNFAYLALNSESGRKANIANLTKTKLAIVIAHEMGHVLGLGHTQKDHSLMYFDATARTTLSLSQDDIDGLAYLYPRHEIGGDGLLGCNTIRRIDSDSDSQPPLGKSGAISLGFFELFFLFSFAAVFIYIEKLKFRRFT